MDCPELTCDCLPLWPVTTIIPPPCEPIVYPEVMPSIFTNDVSYWNGGGSLPAGTYQVRYKSGAMKYNPGFGWSVNYEINAGFRIVFSGGASQVEGPFTTYGDNLDQAAAEAANAGATVDFVHTGGTIGIYLLDIPYGDNSNGFPNPTFDLVRLCG